NRLGGNSVAETVAAGMIVGEFIADFWESERSGNIPTGVIEETLRLEQAKIDALTDGRGTENAAAIMAEMQTMMTAKVSIFGNGAKDHIDHPDTARRVAEIEALKQQRDGADRFTLQGKLMPYEHLMPKVLRGRNERLGEPLGESREQRAG